MNHLLFKIIEYESNVFNDYLAKRTLFLKKLKEIRINNLDNTKLSILIHDIKEIIDPIKTSTQSIDYFFTNLDQSSSKTIENNKFLFYLLLGILGSESVSEELNEVSDSPELSLTSESE